MQCVIVANECSLTEETQPPTSTSISETPTEPTETLEEPEEAVSISPSLSSSSITEAEQTTEAETTSMEPSSPSSSRSSVTVPPSPSKGPRRTDKEAQQDPTAIVTRTAEAVTTNRTKQEEEEGFSFTWPYIVASVIAGLVVLGVIIASAVIQYKRKKQAKVWGKKEFDYPALTVEVEDDGKSEIGSAS